MEFFGILFLFWFLGWFFSDDNKDEYVQPSQPKRTSSPYRTSSPSSSYLSYSYEEEISVKLAMSIAMADGKLHKSEAAVINKHMRALIDSGRYDNSQDFKDCLNNSLVSSKALSDKNQLKTNKLCKVAANNFDEQNQFQTLQLCLNVMVADGKANREELVEIDKIADKIGIYSGSQNTDYISLRDKALISLKPSNVTKGDTVDEKLGIKKNWSKKKKKQFIVSNYTKWNGRINTAKNNREKKNIQNFLDLLAEAYERYDK